MKKDYYLTLRLTPEATEREIRSAYRRLAIELHPDHSGFGSDPFLELQEAYSVLSDPMRRAVYDREVGEIPVRRAEAPWPTKIIRRQSAEAFSPVRPMGKSHLGLSETFHPSFTERVERLWSDFELLTRRKAERPGSLTVDVTLSPRETFTGGQVRILVQGRFVCSSCFGQGHAGAYRCSRCAGYGALRDEYPLAVSYPAGLQQDYVVCLSLDDFGSEVFISLSGSDLHGPSGRRNAVSLAPTDLALMLLLGDGIPSNNPSCPPSRSAHCDFFY